jgi:hypothetical protein
LAAVWADAPVNRMHTAVDIIFYYSPAVLAFAVLRATHILSVC